MTLPVLFLPGSLCDGRVFAGQLAAYDNAQVVDLTRSSTIEGLAADVLAAAPPRFALVGLSLGGIVASEITHQAPDRVAGVEMLDTNLAEPDDEQLSTRRSWAERAQAGQLSQLVSEMVPSLTIDSLVQRDVIMSMASNLGSEVFARQNDALFHRRDRRENPDRFDGPVLVACGSYDLVCPPSLDRSSRTGFAIHGWRSWPVPATFRPSIGQLRWTSSSWIGSLRASLPLSDAGTRLITYVITMAVCGCKRSQE